MGAKTCAGQPATPSLGQSVGRRDSGRTFAGAPVCAGRWRAVSCDRETYRADGRARTSMAGPTTQRPRGGGSAWTEGKALMHSLLAVRIVDEITLLVCPASRG